MPTRSGSSGDRNSHSSHDGDSSSSSSGGTAGSRDNTRSGSGSTGAKRGFAAMDPREQREIAHEGGRAVSRDRAHMSEIGRKGAQARNAERSASRGKSSGSEPGSRNQRGGNH